MTVSTEVRVTPGQRLARGLAHTAGGPVDITRGTLGLTAQSAAATFAAIRRRYRESQLRKQLRLELAAAQESLGRDLAAAQEVIAGLPESFQEARAHQHSHSKRPWLIAAAVVGTLAVGGAAFAIVRRKSRPEPSSLPPSVQVEPKP